MRDRAAQDEPAERKRRDRHWLIAASLIVALGAAGAMLLAASEIGGFRSVVTADESAAPPASDAASASAPAGEGSAREANAAGPEPAAVAQEVCEARLRRYQGEDNPFNTSLAATFAQTAADAAAEDERVRGGGFRSGFRDRPPGQLVALCYFDADAFGLALPPSAGRSLPPRVPTRLQEVVSPDGTPYVLRSGAKAAIPVRALDGGEA